MCSFDYQEKDLFGQSCDLTVRHKEAYVAFVEKFERKKTTDDCYTPECVYEAVLEWLHEKGINMNKYQVVRPFYPDKDYKLEAYPDSCIVVDNPPFSIISEICRWYSERGIKFFLFAPHLTLFPLSRPSNTLPLLWLARTLYIKMVRRLRRRFCRTCSATFG